MWTVVIPVKNLTDAKSRLTVPTTVRAEYAFAFARDTVSAALACPAVSRVRVVTADPVVADRLGKDGARIITRRDDGMNAAIVAGLPISGPVAAMPADLPAVSPAALAAALRAATGHSRALVADTESTGTVLLTAGSPAELMPRFGPDSARTHRRTGAIALAGDWPGLRRDVDTTAALAEARGLGLGRHSRAVDLAARNHS